MPAESSETVGAQSEAARPRPLPRKPRKPRAGSVPAVAPAPPAEAAEPTLWELAPGVSVPGPYLGIDVGTVRVGLAIAEANLALAMPLETAARGSAIGRIANLIRERGIRLIVVGLPKHMNGQEGASATMAREFAKELADALQAKAYAAPFAFVDERLTSATAHAQLHQAGRKSTKHRSVIDQAAAVVLLQHYLESTAHLRSSHS